MTKLTERASLSLSERHLESFQHYASSGILIATIDDVLKDFNKLTGFHENQTKVPILESLSHPHTQSGKNFMFLHELILESTFQCLMVEPKP